MSSLRAASARRSGRIALQRHATVRPLRMRAPWSTAGARAVLNFSEWDRYDGERCTRAAGLIAAVTRADTMPQTDCTFFNPTARLRDGERAAVVRWASGAH